MRLEIVLISMLTITIVSVGFGAIPEVRASGGLALDGSSFTGAYDCVNVETCSLSGLSTSQSGDVIIAFIVSSACCGGHKLTDPQHLTWVKRSEQYVGNGFYGQEFYSISASTLTNDTLTESDCCGNVGTTYLAALAVSGASTTAPFDFNVNPESACSTILGCSVVTTENPDTFIFSMLAVVSGTNPSGPGPGFSLLGNISPGGPAIEYQIPNDQVLNERVDWSTSPTGVYFEIVDAIQVEPSGAPMVAFISPKMGYPNTQITVTGKFFTGSSQVTVCGLAEPFVVVGDTQILTVSSSGDKSLPETCDVQITSAGSLSHMATNDQFTIKSGSIAGGVVAVDMHTSCNYIDSSCSVYMSTTRPNDVIVVTVICDGVCSPQITDSQGSIFILHSNNTSTGCCFSSSIFEYYSRARNFLTLDRITVDQQRYTFWGGVEFLALVNVGQRIWDPSPTLPVVAYHISGDDSSVTLPISTSPGYDDLIIVPMAINDGGGCDPVPSSFSPLDLYGGNNAFYFYQARTSLQSFQFSCNAVDAIEAVADGICSTASCGATPQRPKSYTLS